MLAAVCSTHTPSLLVARGNWGDWGHCVGVQSTCFTLLGLTSKSSSETLPSPLLSIARKAFSVSALVSTLPSAFPSMPAAFSTSCRSKYPLLSSSSSANVSLASLPCDADTLSAVHADHHRSGGPGAA